MKNKIYCLNNGGSPGWLHAVAVGHDGHILAEHICSHEFYMQHDLGMGSTWKHESYDKHFGKDNWELEWVETDKLDSHEGLRQAIELNKKLDKSVDHDTAPRVVVEFTDGTKLEKRLP